MSKLSYLTRLEELHMSHIFTQALPKRGADGALKDQAIPLWEKFVLQNGGFIWQLFQFSF